MRGLWCAVVVGVAAPCWGQDDAPRLDAALVDALVSELDERVSEQAGVGGPADDVTFLRRVHLDLTGRLPEPAEVTRVLVDGLGADGRAALVERLLLDPARSRHVGAELATRLLHEDRALALPDYARVGFREWLEAQVADDRGWDEVVARLLAAEGETDDLPEAVFVAEHGRRGPEELAGAVSRRLLGIDLDCARCHDHPFREVTQAEFFGVAAVFGRTRVRGVPGRAGVLQVRESPVGELRRKLLVGDQAETFAPTPPVPAGSSEVALPPVTTGSRRAVFARWVTATDNPWFARAWVDWVWTRFFGVGLAPGGDVEAGGARGVALGELAAAFRRSGYSLRTLERAITTSEAYRRGRGALVPRPLSARVLTEALLQAAGLHTASDEVPAWMLRGLRTRVAGEVSAARSGGGEVDLREALFWTQGEAPNRVARGVFARRLEGIEARSERVRALVIATLARAPTAREQAALEAYVAARDDAPEAYEDVLWALIATTEFSTQH